MLKSSLFLKKNTNFMGELEIPWTKNAKFSEYYFYFYANIHGDFQICISVPLIFDNNCI